MKNHELHNEDYEKDFMEGLDKILNHDATYQEVLDFFGDTCKIFEQTYCPTLTRSFPLVKESISRNLRDEVIYIAIENSIKVERSTLYKFSKGTLKGLFSRGSTKTDLIQAIIKCGYAMRQFNQTHIYHTSNSTQKSANDIELANKLGSWFEYVISEPSKEIVQEMIKELSPYNKDKKTTQKGYFSTNAYVDDIHSAYCMTSPSNIDARTIQSDFGRKIIDLILNSKYASEEAKTWAKQQETAIETSAKENDDITKRKKEILDNFISSYQTNVEDIIEFATNHQDTVVLKMSELAYKRALEILLTNKTIEQKCEVLKNAILNSQQATIEVLMKAISSDPEFENKKKQVHQFLSDCLSGKAYGQTLNILKEDYDMLSSIPGTKRYLNKFLESTSDGLPQNNKQPPKKENMTQVVFQVDERKKEESLKKKTAQNTAPEKDSTTKTGAQFGE